MATLRGGGFGVGEVAGAAAAGEDWRAVSKVVLLGLQYSPLRVRMRGRAGGCGRNEIELADGEKIPMEPGRVCNRQPTEGSRDRPCGSHAHLSVEPSERLQRPFPSSFSAIPSSRSSG